jgi:hypothetical protein
MADGAAAAPAAPATATGAVIQPSDLVMILRTVGHGERTFTGKFLRCNRACCLLQSAAAWRQTALNNIAVAGDADSIPSVLGQFHTQYLATDQTKDSFTKIITAQRKKVRNLAFPESGKSAPAATGGKISGAMVTFRRIAYNQFDAFSAEQLLAARNAEGGYPTLNFKIFPRLNFQAQDIRLKCPQFLHTLKPDAFTLEVKMTCMIVAGSKTANQFYNFNWPSFRDGVYTESTQPFLHHGPAYTGDLTADPHAFEKMQLLFQRFEGAEEVTEADDDDDHVRIHPNSETPYKWCKDGKVDYSNKTAVQGIAAYLYAQLSSSYEPRFAQTLPEKKRKKGGQRRASTSDTQLSSALLALSDCINASRRQISAAHMQAAHAIVCPTMDHTRGREVLAGEITEAVQTLRESL